MTLLAMKYQAGLFGSFSSIKPDPEMIKKMVDALQEWNMMPGPFVQVLESGQHANRLMMTSVDSGLNVFFQTGRIDIIKSPTDAHRVEDDSLEDFCIVAAGVMSRVLEVIQMQGNRLSLIADVLIDGISDGDMNRIRDYLLPQEFNLEGDSSKEWGVRKNNIINKDILGDIESFNSILNVSRAQGSFGDENVMRSFDAIRLLWDFNSLLENERDRFSDKHFSNFINSSSVHLNELTEKVLEVLR